MSMPASYQPPSRLWTAEEFFAVRDAAPAGIRYELVEGELLVTPAPARSHQFIAVSLCVLLIGYARAQKLGEVLLAPFDVKLAKLTWLQPDLLVFRPDAPYDERKAELSHLLLAVEVLSPGSARHDRVTKRDAYQHHRVPEYWIVDKASRTFERWRPDDDRPEVISQMLSWHPEGASDPFTLKLEEFFADIPSV